MLFERSRIAALHQLDIDAFISLKCMYLLLLCEKFRWIIHEYLIFPDNNGWHIVKYDEYNEYNMLCHTNPGDGQ